MRKIICAICAVSLFLCCGCRDLIGSSSGSYSYIDDIVSSYDKYLDEQEALGNITVSETTEIYEDGNYTSSSLSGQETIIIDDDLSNSVPVEITEADVNTNGIKPYYYDCITAEQQRIYRLMLTAAEKMSNETISLGAAKNASERISDISIAYRALSCDYPQLFWLPYIYRMSSGGAEFTFEGNYPVTSDEKTVMQSQINNVLEKIVAATSHLDSRFEKQLYIHDYLCNNVEYADDGDMSYTAYGALVNGKAVCEGYSRAMQLICDRVGIPCTVIYGVSRNSDHMWNVIDPGDGWYHLDVTWDDDDKNGIAKHRYFNLTDEQIKSDHTISPVINSNTNYTAGDNFNLTDFVCDKQYYNFFVKKNYIFTEDLNTVAAIITDEASKGNNYTEMLYKNSSAPEQALQDVQSILDNKGSNIKISKYSLSLGSLLIVW